MKQRRTARDWWRKRRGKPEPKAAQAAADQPPTSAAPAASGPPTPAS